MTCFEALCIQHPDRTKTPEIYRAFLVRCAWYVTTKKKKQESTYREKLHTTLL